MTGIIRVFLADDHPLIHAGICAALNATTDIALVDEASEDPWGDWFLTFLARKRTL